MPLAATASGANGAVHLDQMQFQLEVEPEAGPSLYVKFEQCIEPELQTLPDCHLFNITAITVYLYFCSSVPLRLLPVAVLLSVVAWRVQIKAPLPMALAVTLLPRHLLENQYFTDCHCKRLCP